jgi:DNA-binding GntR family transcriptional regulator
MTALTRAETAALAIREAIIEGEYLSGERLVELTLSKRLNISQSTVRDALRLLEQQGWVIKQARHGVYVRSFDATGAQEVLALLCAVEITALDALIGKRNRLAEATTCVASARQQAEKGQRIAAIESLFLAHEALVRATGRGLTAQLVSQLANQMRLLEAIRQARIPPNVSQIYAYVESHEALLMALEQPSKDPASLDHARRILENIFTGYGAEMVEALRTV